MSSVHLRRRGLHSKPEQRSVLGTDLLRRNGKLGYRLVAMSVHLFLVWTLMSVGSLLARFDIEKVPLPRVDADAIAMEFAERCR